MVLIEIHEINATAHRRQQQASSSTAFPSGYAFRLIYNGEVLTSRMDGCDSEFCDSLVLVERVRPFARPYDDADCASSPSSSTPTPPDDGGDLVTEMERATRDMLVAPGGAWAMALLAASSMVLGGVIMWFLMRQERRKYESYAGRDGDVVMGLSMRAMSDDDGDGRRDFRCAAGSSGIDSAVSAGSRTAHPHEDEKKSVDIGENELI
jgi:hypothetical protein